MSESKKPSKLVPTTVSKEELEKLVSEWRPYCLIAAIYFKAIRYGVLPIAVVCIIGWAIGEISGYKAVVTTLVVIGAELLRKWFLQQIPFYCAPNTS